MTDQLLQRTKSLLERCDLSLPELATQAGLGYEWLKKFAADDIPDPGVRRVQKLHDFLVAYVGAQGAAAAPETARV